MKRRPLPGPPVKPLESTPNRGTRRWSRVTKAIGAAAVSAVLVGLGAPASSAPRPSEGQPAGVSAVSEHQTLQPAVNTDVRGGAVPAAPNDIHPGPVKQPLAPDPAVQAPTAPGTPEAPIAELRRVSAAFEAAAGKASAPGPAPTPGMPEPVMPNFTDVATGAALGELQSRFDEFQHNGWVQTGSANVIGTERVEVVRIGGVPTHRISVCIDSSGVEIRDTSGTVVLAAVPSGTRTASNIYDIQQHKGKWLVVGHSFPDAAAC